MKLDMSAAAITSRLRLVSDLSARSTAQERVESKIDMSPEGISRRLREVSELRDLCLKLQAAWHRGPS